MHRLARAAALFAFLSSSVPAQDGVPGKVAAPPPLEVSLTAASGVVKIGQPLVLELAIKVNAAAKLPVSAIGGVDLETSVDGKQ